MNFLVETIPVHPDLIHRTRKPEQAHAYLHGRQTSNAFRAYGPRASVSNSRDHFLTLSEIGDSGALGD